MKSNRLAAMAHSLATFGFWLLLILIMPLEAILHWMHLVTSRAAMWLAVRVLDGLPE